MIQRNLMCVLFLCFALSFTAAAQDKTPPAAPATPAAPAAKAQPSTPAAAPPAANAESDLVVLKVYGEPISEKSVLAAINQISSMRQLPPNPDQPRNLMLYQGAIDNLTISAILKYQSKQQNIVADQAKVDQQMQAFVKQSGSQENFQKALATQKITEEELRKRVEESVRVQQLLDQAVKDVPPPTEEEIQKFYDNNPKSFQRPEGVHSEHILLMVDKNATPEQKAEIKKKIEGIRAEIESGAITFEDAAKKYSEDKSNAANGGDLGFFPRGRMVKPFDDAAFATPDGTVSPVIETQYGFHLIKTIEHKPAGTVSLEEAKSRIVQFLEQTSKRKASQQYVDGLKAKATVETFMTADEFLKRHPDIK